jgi:hypothetical protein
VGPDQQGQEARALRSRVDCFCHAVEVVAAVPQQTQPRRRLAALEGGGLGQLSPSPTRQRLQAVLAEQPQEWRPSPDNPKTSAKLSELLAEAGFTSPDKTVAAAEMADGQEAREVAAERLTPGLHRAPEVAEQTAWCR